jgi:hypothetical protein
VEASVGKAGLILSSWAVAPRKRINSPESIYPFFIVPQLGVDYKRGRPVKYCLETTSFIFKITRFLAITQGAYGVTEKLPVKKSAVIV